MAEKPPVIAHGGSCPNGYIFDHNKSSITYGKCIWASLMKPAKKPAKEMTRKLSDIVRE